MAAEKLTKRIVDALKAPETFEGWVKVREHFVWDKELRGFGVQVMPSGPESASSSSFAHPKAGRAARSSAGLD